MALEDDFPSGEAVRAVLAVLAPDYADFSIQPLAGSYSNHTHLLTIRFPNRPARQIVLRRYNVANGNCEGKARREFGALEHLQTQAIPVPKPLLLDDEGKLLGSPGIVTEFVRGQPIEAASKPEAWAAQAETLARMLARIHATPYDDATKRVMMNGNLEAVWFIKSGVVPPYMAAYHLGADVWDVVASLFLSIRPVKPVLTHLDYWSGNILWDQGQVSAVVDWEEAAYGDPGIDVAYCRMEFFLAGLDAAAETFLRVYEREAGHKVANLGFWELAAAARPMLSLDEWLTYPLMHERFERFIANARQTAFHIWTND